MLRLDRARLASRTMITWSKGYPQATGRDFSEVMAELGLDDEAAIARLAPAGAIYFLMAPADVDRIFAHPLTMVGSDGLPFDPHPHPRQWGTFTNVLRTMVRERRLLSLEAQLDDAEAELAVLESRVRGIPEQRSAPEEPAEPSPREQLLHERVEGLRAAIEDERAWKADRLAAEWADGH